MNKLLSAAVIIILPAGGLFSSPVLDVFFFYWRNCSEQSAVGLLVRVAGQSSGIAAVCSALCSLKIHPKPAGKKAAPRVCLPIAIPLSREWRCSCGWWFLASEVPTPGVRAPVPVAALPQVSQVHAWDHLKAHLSHASLLQQIGWHLTTSLDAPFLTRLSQCMSRIKLRLCQPHRGHRVK